LLHPPLTQFFIEILTEIKNGIYFTKLPPRTTPPLTHFYKEILTEIIKAIHFFRKMSQGGI